MYRLTLCLVLLGATATERSALAADAPYALSQGKAPLPEKLGKGFAELLAEEALKLADGDKPVATLWLRKEVPVPLATARQFKRKRLDYRSVSHTEFMGLVKLDQPWEDFRKQKIKPGVYTLRLGFQPQDGDHMGTAPFNEFLLLIPVAKDEDPGLLDVRDLQEMSAGAPGGTHPGVMLLFPNATPEDKPKLVEPVRDIWTLNVSRPAGADDLKGTLGFAIVVHGHSDSE